MTQPPEAGHEEDWGGPTPWQQPPRAAQQPPQQGLHAGPGLPAPPPPGYGSGRPSGTQWTQPQAWPQPPMTQPPMKAPMTPPPTYLVQAVLVTVFCFFFPFAGVVAIVFAAQTSQRTAAGDLLGAQKASRRARLWVVIGLVLGCLLWFLYLLGRATSTSGY